MSADASGLRRRAQERYRDAAVRAAPLFERALQDASPFASGETRLSITAHPRFLARSVRVVVAAPTIQAATTNYGARPHVIHPKRKQALAFRVNGRRVVVRYVNHPGNQATHWWDKTLARRLDIWRRALP